jgi:transcriptional regulator GlxA family with amidase domain
MKIDVLVLDGVFDTGLAAVLDAFATANELGAAQGLTSLTFDVTVVGLRRRVRTNQGFTVPVSPARDRAPPDWVVVPAIGERAPEPLAAALAAPEARDAARILRQWGDQGAHVAAACIGTFVAAESGLLNGEVATTTWWLAQYFRLETEVFGQRLSAAFDRKWQTNPQYSRRRTALGHCTPL